MFCFIAGRHEVCCPLRRISAQIFDLFNADPVYPSNFSILQALDDF